MQGGRGLYPEEVRTYSYPLKIGATTVEGGTSEFRLGKLSLRLRKFQEDLMRTRKHAILSAPTGSGKTLTLFLKNKEKAVGVYPSRALVDDQYESIASLLDLGCEAIERGPNYSIYDCGKERYVMAKVTSESLGGEGWRALEEVCKKVREELDRGSKAIIFTVPEYPYYTLSGEYGDFYRIGLLIKKAMREEVKLRPDLPSEIISRDEAIRRRFCAELLFVGTLFFDEFHAYAGKSFYGALALIAIYTSLPLFEDVQVIISSATQTDEFELAKKLLEEYEEVVARPGEEVVRGETKGETIYVKSPWPGAAAFAYAGRVLPKIVKEKKEEIREIVKRGDKVIIIVDKVASVYEAYKIVKDLGKAVCVTSMAKELGCAGDPREADIIIGNEAISYGIDIKELRYGIITANLWYQLVQRVGRLGRDQRGAELTLVLPLKARSDLNLTWEEFVEWAKRAFPSRPLDWYRRYGIGVEKAKSVLTSYNFIIKLNFKDKIGARSKLLERAKRAWRMVELVEKYHAGGKVEVHLGPLATFYFSSFRGSGEGDIIIKARNFKLSEDWKVDTDTPISGYLAFLLTSSKGLEELLRRLKGKVLQLRTVKELLSEWSPRLSQVAGKDVILLNEYGSPLKRLYDNPVTVYAEDEDYMRYLLSVEYSIGLVVKEGGEPRLKGIILIT